MSESTFSSNALIETDALVALLNKPVNNLDSGNVRIIDATYHIPPSTRNAAAEFEQAHIPGAVFFDIDAIANTASSLPHMLPPANVFETLVSSLGIGNQHHIIVYDTHGVMSAPRVWWMFRFFGHTNVRVLNGGLPKWQAEGRPLVSGHSTHAPAAFRAKIQPNLVAQWEQLHANLSNPAFQVLDVRAAGRFAGTEAEPRPGLRAGHIPGSLNLPWGTLLDPIHKTLLPPQGLRQKFEQAGLDFDQPVVCSCGSGITACVAAFALYLLGSENASVYDGAWAEWGARNDLPIER